MPQHDYDIANGSGAAFRADLNAVLAAIASTNKGPTPPSTPQAGMLWVEDDNPSATQWTVRMYDGADWIAIGILNAATNAFTLTGALTAPAGTAAAPSIAPSGDSNTGIFFPAADTIAFSEGGVEAMRLDASGRVGVGTATPEFRLEVKTDTNRRLGVRSATTLSSGMCLEAINDASASNVGMEFRGSDFAWISTGTERARITAAGDFQFNSGYGSVATAFGCRAWVCFNGTGTVAIRASGNVSSITDNGIGDYTVNFTNAMPNTNYAVVAMAGGFFSANQPVGFYESASTARTNSLVRIFSSQGTGATPVDGDFESVAVFR